MNSLRGDAIFFQGSNFYSKQNSYQKNSHVITSSSINKTLFPHRGILSLGVSKPAKEYSLSGTSDEFKSMIVCPKGGLYDRQSMCLRYPSVLI